DGPWAVAAAVAPRVERHHAEVTREVRDLALPEARVDDGPGRHQQDGRAAAPVDLVEDLDPVALHIAVRVWVSGSHRRSPSGSRPSWPQASDPMLQPGCNRAATGRARMAAV